MRTYPAWLALCAALACAARADEIVQTAQPQTQPQAQLQPCTLPLLASLDVATAPTGMIVLPAAIDGHKGGFLVDTGGLAGVIGWGTAKQLSHSPYVSDFSGVLTGGMRIGAGVTVEHFDLGPLSFEKVGFLIAPDRMLDGNQIGVLQPHAITNINYEIDFVRGKLNLFRQNACPDRNVYWTRSAFAKVPMAVNFRGHMRVQAILDGKPLSVLVDTGAQNSIMSLKTAKKVFGIDEKNPAIKPLGHINVNNLAGAEAYRYPFGSLTFEGFAIAHPNIVILDAGDSDSDEAEMVVGIGVLRQFHLFIAYDENALYLTPAEAY
jgi:predicted aspartyl protease